MVQQGSSSIRHPAAATRFPRGIVIAVAPHSQPSPPEPPRVESLHAVPVARDWRARAARQQRRWREPPVEQATRRFALVLVLLLHGLFGLIAWFGTRPPASKPEVTATAEQFMQVRFFDSRPAMVAPPPPAMPKPPPPHTPPVPPAKGALVVQTPPSVTAAPPRLFDDQGRPLLPATAVSAPAPVPGYVQRTPQGDTQIMKHDSPIKYRPTRFEDDWREGGSSVDDALQKLVDKTTVKKTIRLPGGLRIHCAVSLAMLAGGCGGDPPPPPSRKDGDERLNMAPARSLDGDAHGFKPPSVESCIAMYRAGEPLSHGCPVDTPNRSVDAELRERAGNGAAHP